MNAAAGKCFITVASHMLLETRKVPGAKYLLILTGPLPPHTHPYPPLRLCPGAGDEAGRVGEEVCRARRQGV